MEAKAGTEGEAGHWIGLSSILRHKRTIGQANSHKHRHRSTGQGRGIEKAKTPKGAAGAYSTTHSSIFVVFAINKT